MHSGVQFISSYQRTFACIPVCSVDQEVSFITIKFVVKLMEVACYNLDGVHW